MDGGALYIFNKDNYGDTCNPLFVKVDPNGIINAVDDQSSSSAYRAFPNPVMDELQIAGLDLNLLDIVELVDIMGSRYPVTRLGDRLDLSMVPAGIYFIKIKIRDRASEVLKIVKI